MKSGNPVSGASAHDEGTRGRSADDQAASRQVRDIQEIIAKLEIVTKRLALPLRNMPQPRRSSSSTGSSAPGSPSADGSDKTDGGASGS